MKLLISTVALCGLLLAANPVKAELKYSIVDPWMERIIAPPTTTLPIDEHFIALSKAASANVFADVSQIDAALTVPPYSDRQKMPPERYPAKVGDVIRDLKNMLGLTQDRSSLDTVVFWRRPDINHLLDLIIAHQKQMDAVAPAADEDETIAALQEYLEKNYGWKAKAETIADLDQRALGIKEIIPLKALPPELRAPLETELRLQIRRIANTPDYNAFSIASWKDARFRFGNAHPRRADGELDSKRFIPYLRLSTPGENSLSVGVGFPQFAPQEAADAAAAETKTLGQPLPPLNTMTRAPDAINVIGQSTAQARVVEPALYLKTGAGLQTSVAFTVRRQPLEGFVAALQKQSGLKLQLAPNAFRNAVITASSAGMELGDAMQALERLYGAHWKNNGDSYLLESDSLDEMHFLMAQLGISAYYTSYRGFMGETREQIGNRIADEVVGTVDPDLLRTDEGAPFSALPAELQDRVFGLYRNDASSPFIVAQQRLDDALKQDIYLRFAPLSPKTPNFFGRLSTPGGNVMGPLSGGATGLAAYTADGQFICEMLPRFSASKASFVDILRMGNPAEIQRLRDQRQVPQRGQ